MTSALRNRMARAGPLTRAVVLALASLALPSATCARAQGNYQVTDAERAACQGDAVKLCGGAYPDQNALLACMRTHEAKLTPGCHSVFEAGLRRRGLN